ncbi:hypothetical protein SMF913_25567 [Streptomyces malaysiensis]|uniref:Uncharacterized protein n=1 Tax=Streptomyces malaysiensis TaxID=92644 RepID=A0A2J7YQ00_STRMQ|nr:hypothetical protein SMF913_25567 [Streptomyces malaysiensis]
MNEIFSTSGWVTSASPVVAPAPETTFKVPSGSPAVREAARHRGCGGEETAAYLAAVLRPEMLMSADAPALAHRLPGFARRSSDRTPTPITKRS